MNESRDDGFSLIEVVMVIIILGILAAIAIPIFMNQERSAHDAAARSDAKSLGLMIRSAYEEGPVSTVALNSAGQYVIDGEVAFGASDGVTIARWVGGSIDSWCVELEHAGGSLAADPGMRFDAERGYVEGAECV